MTSSSGDVPVISKVIRRPPPRGYREVLRDGKIVIMKLEELFPEKVECECGVRVSAADRRALIRHQSTKSHLNWASKQFALFSSNPFVQGSAEPRANVDLEGDPTGSDRMANALAGLADREAATVNGTQGGHGPEFQQELYKPVINGVRVDATFVSPNASRPGRESGSSVSAPSASAAQGPLSAALLGTANIWQGLYEMPADMANLANLCEPFEGFEASNDQPSPDTSSDQPANPPLLLGAGCDDL